MGFFDKWKKKGTEGDIYKELIGIITGNDSEVLKELTEAIEDFNQYYEAHQELFEERGIDTVEEASLWIAMVDNLIEHAYLHELDYSCEKEDFIWALERLKGYQRLQLSMEEDWFSEDEEITGWCELLDEKWKPQKVCIAGLDIDSDSYVLFPVLLEDFVRCQECAKKLGQRIEYARLL